MFHPASVSAAVSFKLVLASLIIWKFGLRFRDIEIYPRPGRGEDSSNRTFVVWVGHDSRVIEIGHIIAAKWSSLRTRKLTRAESSQ